MRRSMISKIVFTLVTLAGSAACSDQITEPAMNISAAQVASTTAAVGTCPADAIKYQITDADTKGLRGVDKNGNRVICWGPVQRTQYGFTDDIL